MLELILATMRVQIRNSWARPMFRFTLLANPMLNTVLIAEMFRHSARADATAFIILGAGLMGLWSSICFSSVGDISRERSMGTLPFLFATPSAFNQLIFAKVLGNTLLALGTLAVSTLTAWVGFGLHLTVPHPGWLLAALALMVVSFVIISIPISYAMLLSRKTGLYMNLLDIPVTLLCGFVFPLSALPAWTHPLSAVLSPTWTTILLRQSLRSQADGATVRLALIGVGLTLSVYLLLTRALWHAIAIQVRRTGALEVQE